MKESLNIFLFITFFAGGLSAQKLNSQEVPTAVKSSLERKYNTTNKVSWEREKGNYEANWGGNSGEDTSVLFTPSGDFLEMVKAIPVHELPKPILSYLNLHYKGMKISEAGKVTDGQGKLSYEVEVGKKDLVFDENGNFLRVES
jgi:hypothetical protein